MKFKNFILTLAGIALLQQAAMADSVTYTHQLIQNDVPAQGNNFANNYHVFGQYTYGSGWMLGDQFDSSLGQLTSMDWSITLHATTTSFYSYWQPPGDGGTGAVTESWTAQFIRVGSLGLEGKYLYATTDLPLWGENLMIPVGGSVTGNMQLLGTVTAHITDQSLLNDFIQGTAFFVDTKSQYDFNTLYANGGPNAPDIQVDVSYTYNFTPAAVPEPSTIVFGLAGAGIVAMRRRNKAS